jgi:hypothetical protein
MTEVLGRTCEKCDDYSRGRADEQLEWEQQNQNFVDFIGRKKEDAKRNLKEYQGKQEATNKLMASHYRSEISAYVEVLNWFEWFHSIVPGDSEKGEGKT